MTKTTILVTKLPPKFSTVEGKEEADAFFNKLGCSAYRLMTGKRRKNSAFLDFDGPEQAYKVMEELKMGGIFGNMVEVKFTEVQTQITSNEEVKIAANLNVNYNAAKELNYKYPDLNEGTLKNINFALKNNNEFYLNVCHLMNIMNLPPPFTTQENQEEISSRKRSKPAYNENVASDESEISLDVD